MRIGILTGGGDAPGLNGVIESVGTTLLRFGHEVVGICDGFEGIYNRKTIPIRLENLEGIYAKAGTLLGTSNKSGTKGREQEFLESYKSLKLDGLIACGGDGTFSALKQFGNDIKLIGVPKTIDNDLAGSEITIGVDTALNIALEAIDRLKTTAASHHRAFLVEVMGRHCGYLALMAGIAGGAEVVAIPEQPCEPETIAQELKAAYERGKSHAIGVMAEGAKYRAADIAAYVRDHHERIGFDLRVTALGHVQRGGTPGAFDRLLATRLGAGAVDALVRGQTGVLVGLLRGEVATTPLADVAGTTKPFDLRLMDLARMLAR